MLKLLDICYCTLIPDTFGALQKASYSISKKDAAKQTQCGIILPAARPDSPEPLADNWYYP